MRAKKQRAKPSEPAGAAGAGKRARTAAVDADDVGAPFAAHPLQAPCVDQATALFGGRGLGWAVHVGPAEGWRVSSKLAVVGDPPVVGLFAPGTRSIVEATHSASHRPTINAALAAFARVARAQRLCGYADGRGQVRYVSARCDQSGAVELTVVWDRAAYSRTAAQALCDALVAGERGVPWLSVWAHVHSGTTHDNAVFCRDADAWQLLWGSEWMVQRPLVAAHPDSCLFFSPQVFRQANVDAFQAIQAAIRRRVAPGAAVLELYGGVGTIGLSLLDVVASLVCSDENPYNEACFARALATLPPALARKARYVPLDASRMMTAHTLTQVGPCDVLLVDPPRKGLDAAVVSALARPCRFHARGKCQYGDKCTQSHLPPRLQLPGQLIYVSCGFKYVRGSRALRVRGRCSRHRRALQRDIAALEAAGWRLTFAEGHLLFPGADHIETLVELRRESQ